MDGHLGCLFLLDLVSSGAKKIVQVSFQGTAFSSFVCRPRRELLDLMILLCFFFLIVTFFSTCS